MSENLTEIKHPETFTRIEPIRRVTLDGMTESSVVVCGRCRERMYPPYQPIKLIVAAGSLAMPVFLCDGYGAAVTIELALVGGGRIEHKGDKLDRCYQAFRRWLLGSEGEEYTRWMR